MALYHRTYCTVISPVHLLHGPLLTPYKLFVEGNEELPDAPYVPAEPTPRLVRRKRNLTERATIQNGPSDEIL